MQALLLLTFFGTLLSQTNASNSKALEGYWREPTGSVLKVFPCDSSICLSIATIQPGAPTTFDIHNPDPAQRSHSLCGKVLGKDFHPTSPTHAEGGTLYDPKTGKTYRGEMTAEGDTLHLRGYIGIKAFGRSADWTRVPPPQPCQPA